MIIRQIFLDPTFFNVLVAAPFLASWFFVLAIMIWMFFGVERVRLSVEGLEHRVTALVTLKRRRVPRAELKKVHAGVHVSNSKKGEQPCLKFETLGQPIEFACGIDEEEQRWLVAWLNEYLDAPGPQGSPDKLPAGNRYGITTNRPGTLQPAATPVKPPSDSRIECGHPPEGVAFLWHGRRNVAAIAFLTFFNLFWNAGMAVAVYKFSEKADWRTFLFTVPHQVIGLCLFTAWLVALTAPSWRLTWTFTEQTATRRLNFSDVNGAVVDLGWTKRVAVRLPVRIELVRREGRKQSHSFWTLLSHPDGEYNLSFLDRTDKEMLVIQALTEGDARWIADVLLRTFPSWSDPVRVLSTDWNPQETSRHITP